MTSEIFFAENDRLKMSQTNFVFEADETEALFTQEEFQDFYSDGIARGLGSGSVEVGDSLQYSFSPDYDMEEWMLTCRIRAEPDSEDDETVILPALEIAVDGSIVDNFIDGAELTPDDEPRYRDFGSSASGGTLSAGSNVSIVIEVTEANFDFSEVDEEDYGVLWFDVITLHDSRFNYNFDNEVHEPEGYLDGPELRPPEGVFIEAEEVLADTNITTARLNASIDDHTKGNQVLQLSFDEGETYLPAEEIGENTDSIEVDAATTGLSVQGRVRLSAFPLDSNDGNAQNATPRFGYEGHEIDTWSIDVDTDNLEVLFDQEFNDNRLATISNIADSSNQFFRWEGNVCRIFRQGEESTDVDLKEENITSTTDIEDTYSSVQVKGRNGVEGPIIDSDVAPEYVDRHKEIRDRDIESEQDARRRALDFIAENGEIIYEGDIDTLPTRAPLGEEMSGELFSHGKPMFIERVNYSKRSSSISLGRRRDLGKEIMQLERSKRSSEILDTS